VSTSAPSTVNGVDRVNATSSSDSYIWSDM
jgi:hypothetical protein